MRMKKADIEIREAFVVEQFRNNSDLTVAAVNALLKERFGKAMRLGRMYELRQIVRDARNEPNLAPVVDIVPSKAVG